MIEKAIDSNAIPFESDLHYCQSKFKRKKSKIERFLAFIIFLMLIYFDLIDTFIQKLKRFSNKCLKIQKKSVTFYCKNAIKTKVFSLRLSQINGKK